MANPIVPQYSPRLDTPTGKGAHLARKEAATHIVNTWSTPGAEELTRGVNHLVGALKEKEEEEGRAWSSSAISQARLDWTTNLMERQSKAEPNAPDFTPSLMRDFDAYADETLKRAPTPSAKKFLQERLSGFRDDLGIKGTVFEAQARIDWRSDQFNTGVEKSRKLMNADPGQYKIVLAEQLAIIDASDVPPIKKSSMREKAINGISEAAVWSEIQKSPSSFLNGIGFGGGFGDKPGPDGKVRKTSGDLNAVTGNMAFDALPFERRVAMFEDAVKLRAKIDADGNAAAAKLAKAAGDDAMKEAWSRFYGKSKNGKLTDAYVEQIRPLISDNDYHAILTAQRKGLNEGGPKTDPATFRNILLLQSQGKYAEAEAESFKAHKSGLLSNEHLVAEVNRVRTMVRQEQPKSEYERSRSYITLSLDPGPMVPDPVGKSRHAEAIDTFERWNLANPKAPDKDVEARAKEIVQQYKFINLQDTAIALPLPRSGNVRRNPGDPDGMLADVMKAAAEATKRLEAKRYTPAEYDNEMALINRWRKAIPEKQKPKEAK